MNGLNGMVALSVLENDIQSLAQKVYTGKELDRVSSFYNEHCEAVERELKVNQALKDKLDYNTMFRVLPYKVAKQVADYLEQNEDIKKWLKEE